MFCTISFFAMFFSSLFCYTTIVFNSKFILSARLVLVKSSLVKKLHDLQCARHLFFKEAALGRPKVCNCRQTDFFKNCFYKCCFFFHLRFLAANLVDLCLTLTPFAYFWIWGPISWGPGRPARKAKTSILLKEFEGFF